MKINIFEIKSALLEKKPLKVFEETSGCHLVYIHLSITITFLDCKLQK